MDKVIIMKLTPFFHDHRARSLVQISAKHRLIEDLLNHVKKTFHLDHNVILKTDNDVYIPETEDISIISTETILRVEPLPACDGIGCINRDSIVVETKKKKKSKKRKTIEEVEKRFEEPLAQSSAKRLKTAERISFFEKLSSNNQNSSSLNETHKSPTAYKQRNDTDINSKLENILQSHVSSNNTESSNNSDSLTKSTKHDTEMVSDENNSSKIGVKLIPVYTPARSILPSGDIPKRFNIINNIVTKYDNSQLSNTSNCINMSQNLQEETNSENTTADITNMQCDSSLKGASTGHERLPVKVQSQNIDSRCSEIESDMSQTSKTSYHEINFNYSENGKNILDGNVEKTTLPAPGNIENTNNPVIPISDNDEVLSVTQSESAYFVTRRRVRRRKKKTSLCESPATNKVVQNSYKPMITHAKPLIHKHFSDDEVSQVNDSSISPLTNDEPKISTNVTNGSEQKDLQTTGSERSEEMITIHPPINGKRKIDRHPQPKDIVRFQMLKMDANYEPVKSNMISAVVQTFNKDTKEICVLIKDGLDEFKIPIGNLTFAEEDETIPDQIQVLKWDLLIDAHIQN